MRTYINGQYAVDTCWLEFETGYETQIYRIVNGAIDYLDLRTDRTAEYVDSVRQHANAVSLVLAGECNV